MGKQARWGATFAICLSILAAAVFIAPMQAWATDYKTAGYYVWDGSWHWQTAYAEVLDDIDSGHYTLNQGWYVMTGDWGDGDRPTISGTVNIILEDGCDVHLRDGLHVPRGSTLNIYGQSNNTGKLKVAKSKADTAAIGGDREEDSGTINIYGGDLNVHGGSYTNHGGAGIGGGYKGAGVVRIYGGNILAEGGNEGAGIGGGSNKGGTDGYGGDYNDIKIFGGTVNAIGYWGAGIGGGMNAKGGKIEINGGNITATGGKNSAGIGGGFQKDGGNITIKGGNVTAKGGSLTSNGGAGIGGGGKGGSGTINIQGGTVNASGGVFSAGIGGGDEGEGNGITISGGNVTATGHTQDSNGGGGAAGIGGGDKAAGKNITISGGTVSATGGTKLSVKGGAGIGGGSEKNGENIKISGSANITKAQGAADAAGIGGGDGGEGKNIRIEGGTVNAHGGSVSDGGGAGIGGGQKKTGEVTVTGGNVTATGGGDGAGIGGGEDGSANVRISGGTVTANGGVHGAGIGGGQDGEGGTITIDGGTVKSTGGAQGAGIGGGQDAKSAGTIAIRGYSRITAKGGEGGAGIGGGRTGGRGGTILIEGNAWVESRAGAEAAGIGSGEWSIHHSSGGEYYATQVGITIKGNPTVKAWGSAGGAAIGGGRIGPSGPITIEGGNVYAYGGNDGGSGIGSGSGCEHSGEGISTVLVTINGGNVVARPGAMFDSDSTNSEPGAAIGTGGTEHESHNLQTYRSYFTGHIYLNGGHITAYSADITKRQTIKEANRNVIGTTSAENRDWEKGVVHFGGATVDMYPGDGSGGSIKQMVRASETSEGGIVLEEKDNSYQRVTFTTHNDNINTMREAKLDYRTLVLTGAEDIEEYGGTKLENAKYKHIRVEPKHKHKFTYSTGKTYTENDTIIAQCSGGHGCELSNNQARLILTKPPHEVYGDGKDAGVVVTDVDHIGDAKVAYYLANPDGTRASALDDNNLYEIPTNAGHYWAEITLDGNDDDDATSGTNKATAHVVYTIAKATPTVIPTAVIDEGDKPATIDLAANVKNTPKDGVVTYALDDSDILSAEGIVLEGSVLRIPAATPAGGGRDKATVHVNYGGDDNYNPFNTSIVVTINRQPRPTITPDEVEFRYGETGKSVDAAATGDAGETGAITYAVKSTATDYDPFGEGASGTGGTGATGGDSEWSENDVIKVNKTTGALEAKKAGTATVTVTVAGNNNYAPTTKDITVRVRGAEFPSITAAGYEGEYDGNPHGITLSGVPDNIDAKVYYATTELTDENYQIEGIAADDLSYIDSVQFKDAGEHTVYYYVTAPNYEPVKGSADVKISKKPVNATVYAEDKTYDGTTGATVTATVNSQDLVKGDSIEIEGISGAFINKNAGEDKQVVVDASAAMFSGEGADNYEVTIPASATATIDKAWATVMADDVYVPVGTELPYVYTATCDVPVIGEEIDYELSCDANINVPGSYEIVATADPTTEANSNYDIWCINGTLTVTRPIEVTATGFTGTYDGQPHGITVDVKTPDIPAIDSDSTVDAMTHEDWIALAEWAEDYGIDVIVPDDDWDDLAWEMWIEHAKPALKAALNELKWVEVYYGTEELTSENFDEKGTTDNPSYTDAGTYTVYYFVTAKDGQTVAGSQDVVINKADPIVTAPASVANLRYTGSAQKLVTAGNVEGGTMEYSLDGTTWSKDVPTATEVGSYAVLYRVIGDANHNDVSPTAIVGTIAKKLEPGVTLESWTYDSPAKEPVFGDGVNVYTNGVTFAYKKKGAADSTYTLTKPTQAGEYTVRAVVEASGTLHEGTYTADFSIVPKPLTATVIANDKGYDGTTDAALFAYVDDTLVKQGDSVTISGISGSFADANAGSLKQVTIDKNSVVVSGAGSQNYAVTIPDSTVATIEKASAVIMADDVSIAIGQPLPDPLKALAYAPVKGDQLVYTLSCDYEQKVGEYEIAIELDETVVPNCNYDIVCVPGKLTISKAELTVSAEAYSGTYDGKPHGITVTALPAAAEAKVYYSAERDLDADNCRVAGTLNNPTFTDAGTYRVYYCVIASNYNPVIGFKDVVIAKADASVTAPTAKQLEYTGSPQALVEAGSAEGATLEYSLDGNTWSQNVPTATNAGAYAVLYRVVGDANHGDVAAKAVASTIAKASLSGAKVTLAQTSFTYDGKAKTPAVKSVTVGGKTLVGGTDYTVSYSNNVNTGIATVTVTGKGGYAGTAKATFTIKAAPAPKPAPAPVVKTVDMHRMYNPNSGEHFYTASTVERDQLVGIGWNYEGLAWVAPASSKSPVYRMYNANSGDHHYTLSAEERDWLVGIGWNYEGIGWYSDDAKGTPLYRQFNPNAVVGTHNYTTSKAENDHLASIGWRPEGIAWHGVKVSSTSAKANSGKQGSGPLVAASL